MRGMMMMMMMMMMIPDDDDHCDLIVGADVGDGAGDSVGDRYVTDALATSDRGAVLQINLKFHHTILLSHLTSCHFPFELNPNPVQAEEGSSPLPSPLSKFV